MISYLHRNILFYAYADNFLLYVHTYFLFLILPPSILQVNQHNFIRIFCDHFRKKGESCCHKSGQTCFVKWNSVPVKYTNRFLPLFHKKSVYFSSLLLIIIIFIITSIIISILQRILPVLHADRCTYHTYNVSYSHWLRLSPRRLGIKANRPYLRNKIVPLRFNNILLSSFLFVYYNASLESPQFDDIPSGI